MSQREKERERQTETATDRGRESCILSTHKQMFEKIYFPKRDNKVNIKTLNLLQKEYLKSK